MHRHGDLISQEVTAPTKPARRMTLDDAIRPPPTTAELLLEQVDVGVKPKPGPPVFDAPTTNELPTMAPQRPRVPSAPGVGDGSLDGMVTRDHSVASNLGEQQTLAREFTPEQIAELGNQFATPSRLRPNVEAKREKAQVRNRLILVVVGSLVLSAALGGLYLKYGTH
jgi:hypothetical protein